jgi:hypothetical protein
VNFDFDIFLGDTEASYGVGNGVGFWEGLWKMWVNNTFHFWCFTISTGGAVGSFVPMIMLVERRDVSGAWYWKGLPTRTLFFER